MLDLSFRGREGFSVLAPGSFGQPGTGIARNPLQSCFRLFNVDDCI